MVGSSTKVRKTSIRMTAIKEYPFDLSDLQNQPSVAGDTRPTQTQPAQTQPAATQPNPPAIKPRVSVPSLEGKRKVSIMADESSKDRENLPSDRMSHSSLSCHYDSYLPSDSSLETDALNRHW
ncbi:hypothetical protein HW555_007494 [Spodoptera exigua]|uniref:Uncharacterized protein n=1 Tax=Spodoptera exigua TaxID=7107 RepID=A0A835GG38_SPOEX|nr:hypothetical protein HW555_007494 [Spodoptera exigua]